MKYFIHFLHHSQNNYYFISLLQRKQLEMLEVNRPKGPLAGNRGSQDGNPGITLEAHALNLEGSLEKEGSEGLQLLTIQLEFRAHCVMRCASGNVLVRCRLTGKVALPPVSSYVKAAAEAMCIQIPKASGDDLELCSAGRQMGTVLIVASRPE